MSDESRANRLRSRRRAAKERVQTVEPDEDAETADESQPADPSKPEEDAVSGSVKEEQVGTYMYLPQSQKKELERVYTVAKAQYEYEFDEDFEKNRHFFPLLIQYGIETLDGASAADIKDLLDEL